MDATSISSANAAFLEKVRDLAKLPGLSEARDIAEVVFRTLRDLMTAEAADRVAFELSGDAAPESAPPAVQIDLADLWQDTNPIVSFLSQLRPPLEIDADLFLRRVSSEAGLPAGVTAEAAVTAVFTATKDELTAERRHEVASVLGGKLQALWKQA